MIGKSHLTTPRYWSRGPFYVEWWLGDGLLVWIGRLRFKAHIKVWWARG